MEENKQEQNKNTKKILENFSSSLAKIEAIMGNPTWYKEPKKVGKDEIPNILTRLAETKKEALGVKLETALISLIEDKQKYDKILKEREEAFMKAVLEEMQKFQQRMNAVFAMVDQLGDIEKEYKATLIGIASPEVKSPLSSLQEKLSGGSVEEDTSKIPEN